MIAVDYLYSAFCYPVEYSCYHVLEMEAACLKAALDRRTGLVRHLEISSLAIVKHVSLHSLLGVPISLLL
jgi:hypothetical protein